MLSNPQWKWNTSLTVIIDDFLESKRDLLQQNCCKNAGYIFRFSVKKGGFNNIVWMDIRKISRPNSLRILSEVNSFLWNICKNVRLNKRIMWYLKVRGHWTRSIEACCVLLTLLFSCWFYQQYNCIVAKFCLKWPPYIWGKIHFPYNRGHYTRSRIIK